MKLLTTVSVPEHLPLTSASTAAKFLDHQFINCRVSDDQMSYRSYPLLAARELLEPFIGEQIHGHQAA